MLVSRCIKIRIILWKLILHDETERFAEIKNFFWAESKKLWKRSILNFIRANLTSLWTEIYNFSLIPSNADLYPLNNSKYRMDHWWPALSIRSRSIFQSRSRQRRSEVIARHLVEKRRKEREREREKIYLNYSPKFHGSSKAFTIPPLELKLNSSASAEHQQSQPILLGKYTRSESRISARVSIPRETHDAVQCVRNFSLSNSDPVPSFPFLPLLFHYYSRH